MDLLDIGMQITSSFKVLPCIQFKPNYHSFCTIQFSWYSSKSCRFNAVYKHYAVLIVSSRQMLRLLGQSATFPWIAGKKPISLFHCRNLWVIKAANHYHQTEKTLSSRAMNSYYESYSLEIAALITSYHRRGRCRRHTSAASRHAVRESNWDGGFQSRDIYNRKVRGGLRHVRLHGL